MPTIDQRHRAQQLPSGIVRQAPVEPQRIVNVSRLDDAADRRGQEEDLHRKKKAAKSPKDTVARSSNTVEAFTLTAYAAGRGTGPSMHSRRTPTPGRTEGGQERCSGNALSSRDLVCGDRGGRAGGRPRTRRGQAGAHGGDAVAATRRRPRPAAGGARENLCYDAFNRRGRSGRWWTAFNRNDKMDLVNLNAVR
jgi:hypothetical protein